MLTSQKTWRNMWDALVIWKATNKTENQQCSLCNEKDFPLPCKKRPAATSWKITNFISDYLKYYFHEKFLLVNFFFFFFGTTGTGTQGFTLARQSLYHLSHTYSPFCSGYFGKGISLFAQISLDHSLHIPPCSAFFPLRWSLTDFYAQVSQEPQSL
jgi:hypothetical protein